MWIPSDGVGRRAVPPSQFVVCPGAGELDRAVGVYKRRVDGPAGQGEVLDGPLRVDAVERIGRHIPRAEEIVFSAMSGHSVP